MRLRARGDAGTTLVEVLVATAIMGSAVIVLVTGMGTLINSSGQNRISTTAAVVARDYAEATELAVAQPNAWCSSSYSVAYAPPSGYTVTPTVGACPSNSSSTPQFQTISIAVSGPGGASETITIAVRQP